MTHRAGQRLLRARYRLIDQPLVTDNVSASWIGVGDYDAKYLIKVWPFEGDTPDEYKRALWDAELRTLYRVGSSPGAEETTLIIRDAGLDRDSTSFVMVLEARGSDGYTPLSEALHHRATFGWLTNRDSLWRRELWRGLQRIAEGLQLLHDQNVLHRNLCAESVFVNPGVGPESFRLGGFEWSIRLGQPSPGVPSAGWFTPPEFINVPGSGYRRDTDWYAFGMLAARCLLNVEPSAELPLVVRHRQVVREIDKATGRQLSDLERTFLQRLIESDPSSRLARGHEVRTTINDIIGRLDRGDSDTDARPLVVVINPASASQLLDRAESLGFVPDPQQPQDAFNPGSLAHVTNLNSFIQRDLAQSQLYAVGNQQFYVLSGEFLSLRIVPFESTDEQINRRVKTWDAAFCLGTGWLGGNEGGAACRELPEGSVIVRTVRDVHMDSRLRQNAQSWERYLPVVDRAAELRTSLARFHDFIRCTNQLELLIRDAELFYYEIARSDSGDNGRHRIQIREVERERKPVPWCEVEGGLTEFLQREIDSRKRDCHFVLLTGRDEDGLLIDRQVPREEFWEVRDIVSDERLVVLERTSLGVPLPPPPQQGTIRTFGMFGQVSLIRRRKRAIDRLEKHSYLLRSLSAPGQVYMDTGEMSLYVPLATERVDESKQAAMQDILRVRPIYALQGPPGTGKTTLVSHLTRQILADDPVAQILITAQAHGAVDVLRAKVRDESFRDVDQPLAVRLGTGNGSAELAEGSVQEVSIRVLLEAQKHLDGLNNRSPLQEEWLRTIAMMIEQIQTDPHDSGAGDFCELVRRGASLTYCTTSAGDLEDLADGAQSFDWSIVEEAGKAHGFDLALPLQAGHRWLLIGDPKQLPPYRFDVYLDGLGRLDEAADWLDRLPAQSRRLLDVDWIRSWRDSSQETRQAFVEYAKSWLNVFGQMLKSCRVAADGTDRRTIDVSNGSMGGLLSRQYRMHPTIGDLISAAYYDDELVNRTEDSEGLPLASVMHPFVSPPEIAGRAIVWIDVPWAAREPSCEEQGPRTNQPRYRNRAEVAALKEFLMQLQSDPLLGPQEPCSIAVLSPYNQQVAHIRKQLQEIELPAGVVLKQNLRTRRRDTDPESNSTLAHTVDSFQGNEADVIVVSLVRNNTLPLGDPSALGFLKEAPRLNVLLSRAERLLVLIGSWEFFQKQVAHVPLDDKRQELWHWKKVITLLEEWFVSGRAVKIDAARSESAV